MTAFSTWGACLYHPIDRLARDHGQWPTQHPEMLWTPDKDITFLLETLHAIFNSSECAGADLPAAATQLPLEFVARHVGRAAWARATHPRERWLSPRPPQRRLARRPVVPPVRRRRPQSAPRHHPLRRSQDG